MGDFSITNPSSWSLGNVAEAATEALTGSEFAGDVVGAAISFATGDFAGGVDNVMDGAQNVASFAMDPRVQQAASDAFGTGGTKAPSETKPTQQTQGYPPTSQTGGGKETSGANESDAAQQAGSNSGLNLPDNFASLPLEQKVMAILMALMEKKEGELKDATDDMATLKGGSKDAKAKTASGQSEQMGMNKLQQAQNALSLVSNMITNIQKSFQDSQMAVVRNIR